MPFPKFSAPSWVVGLMAIDIIFVQLRNLYNPSSFMLQYNILSERAARTIAFTLILINGYDLLSAWQNNWTLYYYSATSKAVAAGLFYSFGPPWRGLAGVEAAMLAIQGTAMFYDITGYGRSLP